MVDGPGGTDFYTKAAFAFGQKNTVLGVNGIFQRHGLAVFDIGCLAFVQALIVFIVDFFRAGFCAESAGNTFFFFNETGLAGDGD